MVRRGSTSRLPQGSGIRSQRETRSRGVCQYGNDSSRPDPARGSRKFPQVPADPRNGSGGKGLLTPQIPAYPRSARKRHDRPVTPEVGG
jgi:hypothetical protein